MSPATRHLERLLKALQFDSTSTLGKCGTGKELMSPSLDSTQAIGANDLLGKETPVSSRISFLSCSESNEMSTLSSKNGTKYYGEETTRLVQQLGDSRVQVATLEAQIEFLTKKVEEQEMVDSLYIQRLEGEVLHLKDIVEKKMSKLSRRQTQIEQDVPSLEEQLKAIKDLLHDFNICETMYMDLKSIPKKQWTAREHILIQIYEKHQHDHKEIQELRMSRDNSREALTRANYEVQRLTRDLQRVGANHAIERQEYELDFKSYIARIERLEAELRDSLVQIEVLSAKGALFDEVQGKLETLGAQSIDAKNQNAIMAASLQVAIEEKESMRDSMKEKDHTLDLLSMDKIYLSKEVHCQAQQLKKIEYELERQYEKLREVKCARQELYNKVLTDNKDSQATNEKRLQIHEQTNKDIEKIRKEVNDVADEKVWTFCKMRDEAMASAEMYRAELQDSKRAYNELLLRFQELQRITDLKGVETNNNLKVANFELDQLKVVLKETKIALDQTRLENQTWIAKVKVLKEKINEKKNWPIEELKIELEKQVSVLKEELRVTRIEIEAYRKEKIVKLEAYQSVKESPHKDLYQSERNSLIGISKGEKSMCVSILKAETLDENESKLKGSLLENKFLENKLRTITEEKDRMSIQLQSVQKDIKKLLQARVSVEQLQSLLKEKGVSKSGGSRFEPINTSNKTSFKVKKRSISPQINNLDKSNTSTRFRQ